MCGIAGFLGGVGANERHGDVVRRMGDTLAHRGPDGSGVWADPVAGAALAHRRLAILDVSQAGQQPMQSANGRYVLVFNGEIYNHLDLRADLAAAACAPEWRGHSDTETLLAAIEAWGVEHSLRRTVGMFAFALWDRGARALWLARDRFGEKPLYYGWCGGAFVFGSELKALRAHPGFQNAVCRRALAQYFRMMYIPAPFSIYESIYKLEPGCLLHVEGQGQSVTSPPSQPLRGGDHHGPIECRRWWAFSDTVMRARHTPIIDENEARHEVEAGLRRAIRRQSLSDVPLGAFLSGGVDSTLIVALMQMQSPRPVKTFTMGFEDAAYDEAPHARAVAHHLGTDHTDMMVTTADARALIRDLHHIYDEPFADSSQIPTLLVCSIARQHVTVALSGDAGDELFGGYNRYIWAPRIWNKVRYLPLVLRNAFAVGLTGISPQGWEKGAGALGRLGVPIGGIARLGEKAHKLGSRLRHTRSFDDFYVALVSEWPPSAHLVRGGDPNDAALPPAMRDDIPLGIGGATDLMMYRDTLSYLPDDILCKVDRAAMAHGLETRVPFLDHDVVELAWRLPTSMKIEGAEGKKILRRILYDQVPRVLIDRPKAGFAMPIGQWLRGDLRDWAEALLNETRLRREGYLDPTTVRAAWARHLRGTHDHSAQVWSILMFQSWLEATL